MTDSTDIGECKAILGLESDVDTDYIEDAASSKYFDLKKYFLNSYPLRKVGEKRLEKIKAVYRAKCKLSGETPSPVEPSTEKFELSSAPDQFLAEYEKLIQEARLPIANEEDEALIRACYHILNIQKTYEESFVRVFDELASKDGVPNDNRLKMSDQVAPNELRSELTGYQSGTLKTCPKIIAEHRRVSDLLSL